MDNRFPIMPEKDLCGSSIVILHFHLSEGRGGDGGLKIKE